MLKSVRLCIQWEYRYIATSWNKIVYLISNCKSVDLIAVYPPRVRIRAPFRRDVRSLVPRLLPLSLKLLRGRREEPGNGARPATCFDDGNASIDDVYIYVHKYDRSIDRRTRAGRTAVQALRDRV